MTSRQKRPVTLAARVARQWPGWDPTAIESAIEGGEIIVDGRILTNPAAQVGTTSALRHQPPTELAGRRKLAWAIDHFGLAPSGRTALDVGACTGGFTTAWLEAGARQVYAVDVGHGQLLGSLRQHPRVVNLERTNVGALTPDLIPEPVDLVSVDVSYLSLSSAVSQLRDVRRSATADLLGLIKPMFELRLATIPADRPTLDRAREAGTTGIAAAGWDVTGVEECPVRGARGAIEFFVCARAREG
jgi:23S rRNA (cytidine1920-2'-O)/16S rRNA (cytidine1409-2'-O)-methyltransferase